ncbi:hypothetical protein HOE31_00345 [bacterium]|nr:hypothetical protein [bacterium]
MKYFISILIVMVNLSTINAQKETMTCNEILSFTTIINRTIEIENNEYKTYAILQVPVSENEWLLEHGYALDEIVYVKGFGKSDNLTLTREIATMDARGNAACLGYEEIRINQTVKKDSWQKNKRMIDKLLFWRK